MTKRTTYAFPLDSTHITNEGMTLRDYFAGQALAGINIDDMMPSKNAAVWAYEIADAMLAERGE